MKLTCIVPAYNEELLIEATVKKTLSFWKSHSDIKFHLIVVDDGSHDKTLQILEALKLEYSELEVIHQTNQGKGTAVKNGVLASKNEGILYLVDADMPFSLEDQYRVVQHAFTTTSVAYGSRVKISGIMQTSSVIRSIASFGLEVLNKYILGIKVRDNQCGLKAFHADLAKEIFQANTIAGWGFDLFISSILAKHKIPIGVVPVTLLNEQRPSRVRVISTSFRLLLDIVQIKLTLNKVKISKSLWEKYQHPHFDSIEY